MLEAHRDRGVPFALPHVAAEDQPDAAGFHGDVRFMDRASSPILLPPETSTSVRPADFTTLRRPSTSLNCSVLYGLGSFVGVAGVPLRFVEFDDVAPDLACDARRVVDGVERFDTAFGFDRPRRADTPR